MPYLMFYGEHGVPSGFSSYPSAQEIDAALRNIPLVAARDLRSSIGGLIDYGGWVGNPRITRQATLNFGVSTPNRFTRVAWLYSYPDVVGHTAAEMARIDSTLRDYLTAQGRMRLNEIQGSGDAWTAQVVDYNPAIHGPVSWWLCTSGTTPEQCASTTRTRDSFDLNQQIGGTSTIESPIGPQLVAAPGNFNPLTPLGPTQGPPDWLKWIAYAAAGGAVLYLAWPWLSGTRQAEYARQRA